jgi:hypothetical protein
MKTRSMFISLGIIFATFTLVRAVAFSRVPTSGDPPVSADLLLVQQIRSRRLWPTMGTFSCCMDGITRWTASTVTIRGTRVDRNGQVLDPEGIEISTELIFRRRLRLRPAVRTSWWSGRITAIWRQWRGYLRDAVKATNRKKPSVSKSRHERLQGFPAVAGTRKAIL